MRKQALILVCIVVFGVAGSCHGGSLKKGYYDNTCPDAEAIIKNATEKRVANDPTLPARFLRMHFHDCFVRGCDGSVLLNSTTNNTAEKDAIPNLTLAGFDVIDDIKAEVEKECPNVVSCADVLALAARDAVSFKFQKALWNVLTGRRDGTVSQASEALANLPSPFSNFSTLVQKFANKGLNVQDLVVLSGGHTIGVGHCNTFSNRLYNFTGNGDQDPSLNATYATFLKTQCKSLSDNTTFVAMDPSSGLTFDNNYYVTLKQNKGLFQSDAALITNEISRIIVDELLVSEVFFREFALSMVKMGAIGVLTGNEGEIRKKCSVVN
ncbi:peroxidase 56-like [Gossypium arboreum]|uniref:peroxidase 56-like n=1 Tax=Gossypium arboreum TaxID=29729 RepID=UPI0008196B89|nr:peroxidase 56-like [Gossypium arboreum]